MVETDNKLPDNIIFKNIVILIMCLTKDGDKLFPQIYLEETLVSQIWWEVVKVC